MILTRLDAIHQADGAFCRFFFAGDDVPGKHGVAEELVRNGWDVDLYDEDVGAIDASQQLRLMGEAWPLAATSTLLEWINRPPKPSDDGAVFELKVRS